MPGQSGVSNSTAAESPGTRSSSQRTVRRFYREFRREHMALSRAIRGIDRREDLEWYTSLLFNRLIFIRFFQEQGMFDADRCYLSQRLAGFRERYQESSHVTIFRRFLLPLFHDLLAKPPKQRTLSAEEEQFGHVPYLSGGLFGQHELERRYPQITIPDDTLARLFAFLDRYKWQLEPHGHGSAAHITPDILGNILEQHINQRQLGAYYTRSDVTGYIAANTIIPRLFDMARVQRALRPDARSFPWCLLQRHATRYIHGEVLHGVLDQRGTPLPIPEDVSSGLHDVGRRGCWNEIADPTYGLPRETWREYLARRERCLQLHAGMAAGEFHEIDDLVTANLDLRRFALDTIDRCRDPELLYAIYRSLRHISVLDPTCGSGAFLFAAWDVLEPLYVAAVERMRETVTETAAKQDASGTDCRSELIRRELEQIDSYRHQRAFVCRSILERNLYGVDIMPEAVETCRMRLLLRMAARVIDDGELPDLPDLDRTIRVGNALVGRVFVDAQPPPAASPPPSHRPFHWPLEFAEVMNDGGFDVVIGNPPYVEHRKVVPRYDISDYATRGCGNLCAFTCERSLQLLKADGRIGVIVPLSISTTRRMQPVQQILVRSGRRLWMSHYDVYPSKLFEGAKQRLTILIGSGIDPDRRCRVETTGYNRWYPEERDSLLPLLHYHRTSYCESLATFPKVANHTEATILRKLDSFPPAEFCRDTSQPDFFVHRIPYNYIKALDTIPYFWNEQDGERRSADYKPYRLVDRCDAAPLLAALNSNLFFWWWYCLFEGYHCGRHEILAFPIGLDRMRPRIRKKLADQGQQLMRDLRRQRKRKACRYRTTGRVVYDEFYPRKSKALIDQIDVTLAGHYGLDENELDYIIHYGIKYRHNEPI